ncbi:hypothetical protein P3X46_022172 [Hevea brasiliensis]|uniref:Retrotransposon gag domain-containing protein n=1 Tax=Hevea brasiliensis TaxID=3981 RepID=A0ABQ9LLP0_HEVBR|nr:hypothetical protein P3X46_022172 [Hevea brasiliensis]
MIKGVPIPKSITHYLPIILPWSPYKTENNLTISLNFGHSSVCTQFIGLYPLGVLATQCLFPLKLAYQVLVRTNAIPAIHSTPHLPTGGAFHAVGGENRTRENEKLSTLEERLRAIEGLNMYGSVDVASLRLVPDVVAPPKFKFPDFDKYTGNSDPRIHLATYIAKMSQYKFNCDVAPTRRDLQNLVQRDRESFKEYAQRWREKATEVYPPVTDNELCSLFIETLKAPYFNLMIGNTSNSFLDIIQVGERIEANLRMGRLQELTENPAKKTASFGKKEGG